ncbi:MAG: ParB/RepB/Spo0J family partition protein [Rikenellaceae bacterium]
MSKKQAMGRGLGAIFINDKVEPKIAPMSSADISQIALADIRPNPTQPRRTFDEEALNDLASSIAELGIIQPITLKPGKGDTYIIISGERRWRAAQIAKLESIPAYVREVDDEQLHAMALVENLQRADLNPIEIALSLQRLVEEHNLTQEAVAQRVSMKRSSVSNYLRLLKLSNDVQYALKNGIITMGHAKALASIEDPATQAALLTMCIEESLSVRDTESAVARVIAGEYLTDIDEESLKSATQEDQEDDEPRTNLVAELQRESYDKISNRLAPIFKKGVQIKSNNKGGGKIVINFSSSEELEKLISELGQA